MSGEQGNVATARMPSIPPEESGIDILRRATLGEYEVLAELGRGGMATVYLAHEISLDRKVAIKVMAPQLMFGEGMAERFRREARTAASLSHPHIIPIYAVKEAGRVLYFVMKFVAGRPLDDIIREVGPLPLPMARALLSQVGSALGYAHRRGIIHRDIKPANIMIDDEGWAVVTDFGIAKVAETQGLTMTGVAVGTPSYMSPEQCAAKEVTGRSDQYSLGIVAYEMITGKQPFVADTAMAIMWQHFNDPPRPIRELRPDCPPELEAAVLRMIEKQPDKRWPSIEDAVAAMGAGANLAHDDPIHMQMVGLAKNSLNQRLLDEMKTPTSLVPPTRASGKSKTEVIAAVDSVAVSPRSANLAAGETLQLSALVQDTRGDTVAGREVAWSSGNPALATVSGSGLVTALAPGEVTVTATVDRHSGTCQLTIAPVPVAAVVVAPASGSLEAGATLQLSATLRDPQGRAVTGRSIAWASGNPQVGTVSADGLVAGVSPGDLRITATCEGRNGSATLTVTPAAVAAIEVSPATLGLTVGKSERLTAAVRDQRGHSLTGRVSSWTSRHPDVADVSTNGEVAAKSPGSTEIVLTVEGRTARVPVTVVPVPVAEVRVTPGTATVKKGETVQLRAEARDDRGRVLTGRSLSWSSNKPSVATVSGDGVVTGTGPGSALLTVSCEGKRATADITVPAPVVERPAPPPPPVEPTPASESATQVIVPVAPAPAPRPEPVLPPVPEPVPPVPARRSRMPLLVGVVVLALLAAGAWMFMSRGGEPGTGEIAAGGTTPVLLEAAPGATTLGVGDSVRMQAVYRDSGNREIQGGPPVTWTSDNPAVALVNGEWVKAVGGGSATIIGDAAGLRGTALVTVQGAQMAGHIAVATVTVPRPPASLQAGEVQQLGFEVRDQAGAVLTGRPVTWTSSNPGVAQVSAAGVLTAGAEGSATITAASEGKSASFQLTVTPVKVAAVSLTPSRSSIEAGQTVSLAFEARDARGNAIPGRFAVWSSSNQDVASVDGSGKVRGESVGTATITAAVDGRLATASVTVVLTRQDVAAVTIAPNGGELEVGERLQLEAQLKDAQGGAIRDRTPSWLSSDPAVATVSPTGQVTAIASGTTNITASSDNQRASVRIVVARVPVASLALTSPPANLPVGESFQLSATVRDRQGNPLADRPVTWASSNPQVATVSNTGRVTATGPGSARITATSEGRNANVNLSVTRPVVAVVDSPRAQPDNPTPPPAAGGGAVPRGSIAAGGNHTCGLLPGGAVACWGAGSSTPTTLDGGVRLNRLSSGITHTCGLTSGGEAYCWGQNSKGQVGDGSTNNTRAAPVAVAGGNSFRAIKAGGRHTCGLAGGRIYCWGDNGSGQLGDGSTSGRTRPVQVPGLTFTEVAAGGQHSCGITTDGKAYCWGDGFSGQLGYGQLSTETSPVEVDAGGARFTRIYAGGGHTCALTAAGKAYCWGDNRASQVGDGSSTDRTKPVEVATTLAFEELSLGSVHTCGRTSGGSMYCWGAGGRGQLGDGNRGNRNRPVKVAIEGAIVAMSAGGTHTCAATATQAFCWGEGARGQLGDGGTAARPQPMPVLAVP